MMVMRLGIKGEIQVNVVDASMTVLDINKNLCYDAHG